MSALLPGWRSGTPKVPIVKYYFPYGNPVFRVVGTSHVCRIRCPCRSEQIYSRGGFASRDVAQLYPVLSVITLSSTSRLVVTWDVESSCRWPRGLFVSGQRRTGVTPSALRNSIEDQGNSWKVKEVHGNPWKVLRNVRNHYETDVNQGLFHPSESS